MKSISISTTLTKTITMLLFGGVLLLMHTHVMAQGSLGKGANIVADSTRKTTFSDQEKYNQRILTNNGPIVDTFITDKDTIIGTHPSFKGGQRRYYQYLFDNFKYPVQSIDDEVQGTVTVAFVVEVDGSITNVSIVPGRGLDKYCNAEAIRVVSEMPNWNPGMNNGKPVRTKHILRIDFQLE